MSGLPCATCPWRGGRGTAASQQRRTQSGIAALGEGPAEWECSQGDVFIGPSGDEVDRILLRAGLPRKTIALENAFGCWKPDKASPADEARAVSACRGRVEEFLDEAQPTGLILFGGRAMRSIMPGFVSGPVSDGMMRHRGALWRREEIEAANAMVKPVRLPKSLKFVTVTLHPAAIIGRRRIEKFPAMGYRAVPSLDIRRLVIACATNARPEPNLTIVREQLPLTSDLRDGFVFDLETDGDRRPNLIGVQLRNGGPIYSHVWNGMVEAWLDDALRLPVPKIGHNIMGFDLPIVGIEKVVEPVVDTMILAGLCEPDMARGLFYQWSYYHGDKWPFWKELDGADMHKPPEMVAQAALRQAWSVRMAKGMLMDDDWARFYNALDCEGERMVFDAMEERAMVEGWV